MHSILSGFVHRLATTTAMVFLVGCTTVPIGPRLAHAQPAVTHEESQLFYELLVSELAIRRGELAIAAEGYLRATERTDDPRVAERATQLAVYYQDWDAAEKTAKRWLTLDPDGVGAHESLGQIHLRQGNTADAAEAFALWIDSADDQTVTFDLVNQVLERDPDRMMAYDVAELLAQRFPDVALAHIGAARMALSLGERDAALDAANKALALDSQSVDAALIKAQVQISKGDAPDAIDTLQVAVSAQPDSLPLHMGFAQLLVESDLYDRAGPVMERASELSVGDSDTWLRLGLLALTAERNDQAQRYLMGVLNDDPYNERAHFYLARIADRGHDYESAIHHYDSVPEGEFFITSKVRAAELTADRGDVDDGIERLRELSPMSADPSMKVQLITAESRILRNADRGEEAVGVLSAGLEQYPADSGLLYARALAAESNGDNQQMEDDLAQLLTAEPDNAHALNALGYHLVVNNKRLDDAQTYLEKAIALQPDDAAITDSLGWLRFRQGRLAEAKELLNQAYAIFPDGEIAAHLGEVLWMMGDTNEARSVWNKALESEPDHKVLNEVVDRFVTK